MNETMLFNLTLTFFSYTFLVILLPITLIVFLEAPFWISIPFFLVSGFMCMIVIRNYNAKFLQEKKL